MKKSTDAPKSTRTRTKDAAPESAAAPRARSPRKKTNGQVAAGSQESGEGPVMVEIVEEVTIWAEPTAEDVARRAYEIFESRAWHEGDALSDWVQAERELRKPR